MQASRSGREKWVEWAFVVIHKRYDWNLFELGGLPVNTLDVGNRLKHIPYGIHFAIYTITAMGLSSLVISSCGFPLNELRVPLRRNTSFDFSV